LTASKKNNKTLIEFKRGEMKIKFQSPVVESKADASLKLADIFLLTPLESSSKIPFKNSTHLTTATQLLQSFLNFERYGLIASKKTIN
jgi:hypothetical protein